MSDGRRKGALIIIIGRGTGSKESGEESLENFIPPYSFSSLASS